MFPFKFPYTNFHELNLDWILETTKSNTDRIAANELKIKLIGGDDPLNALHPVGSIYMSTDSESPASLFGGVWEQLKDRFLLGAGDRYIAGGMAGEEAHTLTVDEMPAHAHYLEIKGYLNPNAGAGNWQASLSVTGDINLATNSTGSNQPHNNMPPYLAVYMWKRVS